MVRLFIAFGLLACTLSLSLAQPASISLAGKSHSLNDRYYLMKSNSQTYQDYKVIKEFVLDGVWRIVNDSLKTQRHLLAESHQQIAQLEAGLQAVEMTLKKERNASAQVIHDSAHISVIGVDVKKNTFLTFSVFLFAGLVLTISLMAGKMKLILANMKEKVLIADLISNEYEEFKRRSLDKQMKLSRELQNERNKLEEMKAQFK